MTDFTPDTPPSEEDEFARLLEQQFQPSASDAEPPSPEEPEQEAPETEAPSAPVAPEPTIDTVKVLDRDFQRQEAQTLLDFYDWVRTNPREAIAIDAYMRGAARIVPAGEAEHPSPEPAGPSEDPLEGVDPAIREKLGEIDSLKRYVDEIDQERRYRRFNEAQSAVAAAAESTKLKFQLSDEEVSELQEAAGQLNVVQSLAEKHGDYRTAVEQALEMAFWQTPKFREVAFQRMQTEANETMRRQRKASSVAGGSGSMPRTPAETDASTPDARRTGMVAMLRSAMQNGTEE